MISYPMPFRAVPCCIWLANKGSKDSWGNESVYYNEEPDIVTRCLYAPGTSKPATADDIEDGRPYGDRVSMTFYLPKELDEDLRDALIACCPPADQTLFARKFKVVGDPVSYMRENTPGDYSWCVEAVDYLG